MPEKLAIVTIDAGSDVRAKISEEEVIGTSSGKGTLTDAIRGDGARLGMDRGRAFRTIAYLAAEQGIDPAHFDSSGALERWQREGAVQLCDDGLSLKEGKVPDSELHGKRISKIVAEFGELASIRDFMHETTLNWISWAKDRGSNGLVAIDGRETATLVKEAIENGDLKNAELIKSFIMVVNPVEAARRRMAGRKELRYEDPEWYLKPGVAEMIVDLRERALRDEDRPNDPVGFPPKETPRIDKTLVEEFRWDIGKSEDLKLLADRHRESVDIVFDTTGFNTLEVKAVGLKLIESRRSSV